MKESRARAEAATCWTSQTRRKAGDGRRQAGGLGALRRVPHALLMPRPSSLLSPALHPLENSRAKCTHILALAPRSAAQSHGAEGQLGRRALTEAGAAFRTQRMTRTGLGTAWALALPCMEAPGSPTFRAEIDAWGGQTTHLREWQAQSQGRHTPLPVASFFPETSHEEKGRMDLSQLCQPGPDWQPLASLMGSESRCGVLGMEVRKVELAGKVGSPGAPAEEEMPTPKAWSSLPHPTPNIQMGRLRPRGTSALLKASRQGSGGTERRPQRSLSTTAGCLLSKLALTECAPK